MAFFKPKKEARFGSDHGSGSGGRDSRQPDFYKKNWEGGARDRGMHKTTCAQCGNPCEVPFRPIEGRPVYCTDCFKNKKEGGNFGRENRFPKRDFGPSKQFAKPEFSGSGQKNDNEIKRQLEILNGKMDRLIRVMEAMGNSKPAAENTTVTNIPAAALNAFPEIKDKKAVKKAVHEAEKKIKKAAKKASKKAKK